MQYSRYPSYKDSGIEWLGRVPEHWAVGRIKNSAIIFNGATPKSITKEYWDGDISWIGPADMGKNNSRDISNGARDITSNGYNSCGTTLVPKGSVVLSSRAPIGKVAIAGKELCTNQGCKSLVVNQHFSNIFIFYILISNTEQLNLLGRGTTFLELSADELGSFSIPIPPLQEQKTIASYLDIATAKIDTLIEKQTKLIELLKEKRQAVISTAVTRGLDPSVPMKDSGVEWLGEIPEHWDIGLLSSLFISNKKKNSDLSNKNLLSLSYGRVIKKNINASKGLLPENFNTYQIVEEGYIILRLTDLQNDKKSLRTGYVNENGIITSAYIGLAKKSASIGNEKYFHLYLHTFDIFKGFYGMGAGVRQGLNFDELKKLKFTLPSHEEQNKIVEYIEIKTKQIDNLLAKSTKAIDLLKEKRTALISSVVTGKIDVRGVVA